MAGRPTGNRRVRDQAVPSTTVTGNFEFDNDVALFQFLLGPGTFTFTAATTSAANSFDPILKLFAEDGTAVTYTADDGGVFEAVFSGDFDDAEVQLPLLTLAGGSTYTLALSQFGNNSRMWCSSGWVRRQRSGLCYFNMGDIGIGLWPERVMWASRVVWRAIGRFRAHH